MRRELDTHGLRSQVRTELSRRPRLTVEFGARLPGGEASMSAGTGSVPGWLPFRRIVDVPFETCLAAVESWQRTGPDGELRIGDSRLRGPIEHDRDSGTRRIEVRLARGPLRPLLRMRLYIDRWSPSSTALELIPCGRVRPTAAYFRAGHLLLDLLIPSLLQHQRAADARDAASQPPAPVSSSRP
jgi:hypothetical protein